MSHIRHLCLSMLFALTGLALLSSCGAAMAPKPLDLGLSISSFKISAVSGGKQTVVVNKQFPVPLVVLVTDSKGVPMPAVPIVWALSAGNVTTLLPGGVTDPAGLCTTVLTAGAVSGAQIVSATIASTALVANFDEFLIDGFVAHLVFSSANASSFAPASSISFTASSCALTPVDQLDDDNSASGFGGGTFKGVLAYGSLTGESGSSGLKLGNNGSCDGSATTCEPGLSSAARSGSFTSRVIDAYASQNWTTLTWTPTLPFFKPLPDYSGGSIQNETSVAYSSLVGSTGSLTDNNLMSSIAALWHFDESSWSGAGAVKDSSGHSNHGTTSTATTIAAGRFNGAGIYDGSTANIAVSHNAALNPNGGGFTTSAWVKTNVLLSAGAGELTVLSKGIATSGSNQEWDFSLKSAAQGLSFRLKTGGGTQDVTCNSVNSSAVFDDHLWHHVAAVINPRAGTQGVLYVDGAVCGSTATENLTVNPTEGLYIGQSSAGALQFSGSLDEIAIWNRALNVAEVKQLYQRGASRLKFQTRSCALSDCSDGTWKGPDHTSTTWYSELFNMSTQAATPSGTVNTGLPTMTFANFTAPGNNRFFQYRVLFESDTATPALMPELKSVSVGPVHYDKTSPVVTSVAGIAFNTLSAYVETLGSGGCSGGVTYNLSPDKITWYYWNGTAWAEADGSLGKSNAATVVTAQIAVYGTQLGAGTVYVKAFLNSDGLHACELNDIEFDGQR